jgi:co-chaperonin GroES (HSP10)
MTPLGNRILIKYMKTEETRISGLVIPVDERTPTQIAEVLAVNVLEKDVKVGDKVLVRSNVGVTTKEGVIVPKEEVLAVVE